MYKVTNEVEKKIVELAITKARTASRLLPNYKDIINSTIETLSGGVDGIEILEFNKACSLENEVCVELAKHGLVARLDYSRFIGFRYGIYNINSNELIKETPYYKTKLDAIENLNIDKAINEFDELYNRLDDVLSKYTLMLDIVYATRDMGIGEMGFRCSVISTIDNTIKKSSSIHNSKLDALKSIDVNEIIRNLNI